MPGFSGTTEGKILDLIYRAAAWGGYADNTATTPQANISFSLHTASPGDAGTQTTSEVTVGAYNTYARVNRTRDSNASTGFAAPTSSAPTTISPQTNIDFAAMVSGTGASLTDFATGSTGTTPAAGTILMFGTIAPSITVAAGVTPRLTTATTFGLN